MQVADLQSVALHKNGGHTFVFVEKKICKWRREHKTISEKIRRGLLKSSPLLLHVQPWNKNEREGKKGLTNYSRNEKYRNWRHLPKYFRRWHTAETGSQTLVMVVPVSISHSNRRYVRKVSVTSWAKRKMWVSNVLLCVSYKTERRKAGCERLAVSRHSILSPSCGSIRTQRADVITTGPTWHLEIQGNTLCKSLIFLPVLFSFGFAIRRCLFVLWLSARRMTSAICIALHTRTIGIVSERVVLYIFLVYWRLTLSRMDRENYWVWTIWCHWFDLPVYDGGIGQWNGQQEKTGSCCCSSWHRWDDHSVFHEKWTYKRDSQLATEIEFVHVSEDQWR